MLSENQAKSANFLRIVQMLKTLREDGIISGEEYRRAKTYYQKLTGADIIIVDWPISPLLESQTGKS